MKSAQYPAVFSFSPMPRAVSTNCNNTMQRQNKLTLFCSSFTYCLRKILDFCWGTLWSFLTVRVTIDSWELSWLQSPNITQTLCLSTEGHSWVRHIIFPSAVSTCKKQLFRNQQKYIFYLICKNGIQTVYIKVGWSFN